MSTSTETTTEHALNYKEWRTAGQVVPDCEYQIAGMTVVHKCASSELVALIRDRRIAEQIVIEHNGFQLLARRLESQASTLARITGERDELRAARDRLLQILSMIVCHGCNNRIGWNETPTKYGDWTKCSSCRQARAALNRRAVR